MFALLDRLGEINENILAHVQTDQLSQAGHGSRHLAKLIVSQTQVLQAVAVEQRSKGENTFYTSGGGERGVTWAGLGCCYSQV